MRITVEITGFVLLHPYMRSESLSAGNNRNGIVKFSPIHMPTFMLFERSDAFLREFLVIYVL